MSTNLFDVPGWTLGVLAPHESHESHKPRKIKHKNKKRKPTNEDLNVECLKKSKLNGHELLDEKAIINVKNKKNEESPKISNKPKRFKDNSSKSITKSSQKEFSSTITNKSNKEKFMNESNKKNSSMQQKMLKGKFRWINEKLYTSTSSSALELFQNHPQMFEEYHQGFSLAVRSWPINPVDIFINYLKGMSKELIVADLGCGEGKIAQEAPNKVLSFDLVAKNHMIIACDIAKLPIPDSFFDIAIFCLSLMGTNYIDFLKEAHRILKPKGMLKIAEVVSRFYDFDAFIKVLAEIGFKFVKKDDTNRIFFILDFIKSKPKFVEPKQSLLPTASNLLKPCNYKKR